MKDYRIEIKVKNNRILRRMNDMGIKNVSELTRLAFPKSINPPYTRLGKFVNMTILPFKANGEWRSEVIQLSEFFRCLPEDLFSEQQQTQRLKKNRSYIEATSKELPRLPEYQEQALPDEELQIKEVFETLDHLMIERLKPRYVEILKRRYGIGDYEPQTLKEVASHMNITIERVRQIQIQALQNLRGFTSTAKLLEAGVEIMLPRAAHNAKRKLTGIVKASSQPVRNENETSNKGN